MKLHYSTEQIASSRYRKIKAVALALGINLNDVAHQAKADLSKISPFNALPLLETSEGSFFSSNTIIRYLASTAGNKLYGGDNLHHRALIDQWLDVTACDFQGAVSAVIVAKQGKQFDGKAVAEDIHKFLGVMEKTLHGKKFLVGDNLSIADLSFATGLSVVFTVMLGQQERKTYPNLIAYYLNIASADANNVGPQQLPKQGHKAFKGKKQKKQQKKQQKKPVKQQGDDLFDDAPAAAPVQKKQAPKKQAKKQKKKVIAKSIVVFDVKVYEQQTDLLVLFKKITTEITIDGLVWNNEPKILPVAFGMNKLQVGCVIQDQKVSTDDIFEKIEEWEEVQSVDTVSFQKL